MVSDVTPNVRTLTQRPDELRMLDPAERRAAKMAWDGADLIDIAEETGLSWQHIREAVALQARWRREPPPTGWDPGPKPEPVPELDPDPLGAVGDLSTPLPARPDLLDSTATAGTQAPEVAVSALATQIQEGFERRRDLIEQMPADAQADVRRRRENIQRLLEHAQAEEAQAEAGRDAELEQLVQRRPSHRPVSISIGDVDLAQAVRAAERGDDAHARALAGRIRRLAGELSAYLAIRAELDLAHQQISALQHEVQALTRLARRRDQRQTAPRPTAPTAAVLKPTDDPHYATTVRDWARRNGYDVAERGRIKQPVIDAYIAAHAETTT